MLFFLLLDTQFALDYVVASSDGVAVLGNIMVINRGVLKGVLVESEDDGGVSCVVWLIMTLY